MTTMENKLTFLRESEKRGKGNKKYAWYLCECGTEVEARKDNVKDNSQKSCGCIQKSNRLPLGRIANTKLTLLSISMVNGRSVGEFLCDCGNTQSRDLASIKSSSTKSCGCLIKEVAIVSSTTHGMSSSPECKAWYHIRDRCNSPNNKAYKYYGGRGITVCDRWLESFENFYEDMGDKPSANHSIERINVDGNYEPSNCKWATSLEQGRNKRSNVIYSIDNVTKCLSEWIEIYQATKSTVYRRLKEGKSIEDALGPTRLRKG